MISNPCGYVFKKRGCVVDYVEHPKVEMVHVL